MYAWSTSPNSRGSTQFLPSTGGISRCIATAEIAGSRSSPVFLTDLRRAIHVAPTSVWFAASAATGRIASTFTLHSGASKSLRLADGQEHAFPIHRETCLRWSQRIALFLQILEHRSGRR